MTAVDAAFKNRQDHDSYQKAVTALDAVRNPGQRSYDVEWKFAKYSFFLAKETPDDAQSQKIFERARDAGKIAMRLEPTKPDGWFWYGANLGELSRRSPITVGLKSIDDIREAMNKVIEIDPSYQNGSAFDGLGQLELATKLNGGSAEKAVGFLEKGLQYGPDNAFLHLHLGQAYLDVKKDAQGKEQLEYVIKMKPDPDYVPEHAECVAEAKKLLETNF